MECSDSGEKCSVVVDRGEGGEGVCDGEVTRDPRREGGHFARSETYCDTLGGKKQR